MMVRACKLGRRMFHRGMFADRTGGMHGVRLVAVTRQRRPSSSHICAVTCQSGAACTGRRAAAAQAAARSAPPELTPPAAVDMAAHRNDLMIDFYSPSAGGQTFPDAYFVDISRDRSGAV